MAKATKAVQILDTVEFRHHHLILPDLTPADRIFHGVTTLTCSLRNAPAIACDNQLVSIQALRQSIQPWSQPNLPSSIQLAPVPPPPSTPTRRHSVLRPMRRQEPIQPHASLPRVFIPTPNTAPSAPRVPSTQEKYEPIAWCTRYRVTHNVDPPPPRVGKETDPGPIARNTRSQTTSIYNVITPYQAAKQRYSSQFLQILAIPVLD